MLTKDRDNAIREKIVLLCNFCLLKHTQTSRGLKCTDKRKDKIKQLLAQCTSEYQMDTVLHDVLMGRETVNQLLQRKGLM